MTCLHTLRAAISKRAPTGAATAMTLPQVNRSQSDRSAPASLTETGPRPDGAPGITPDLTARAMTMCNRDRIAADRYLAVHQALASRIYSGGSHD